MWLLPVGQRSCRKGNQKDLDLLKNLDSETTMQYISYQELFPDSDDSTELSADIKEVFSLFFQNFNYKITGISVDSNGKNASAQLKLTTLDAETLASDFVSASLQEEILETASGKENDNGNSWSSVICSCTSFSRITRTVL